MLALDMRCKVVSAARKDDTMTYTLHVYSVAKSAPGATVAPAPTYVAEKRAAGETTDEARADALRVLEAAGYKVRALSFGPEDIMVAYVEE